MRKGFGRIFGSFAEKYRGPTRTAAAVAVTGFVVLVIVLLGVSDWYERQLVAEKRAEAALEVSLRGNVLTSIMTRRFARLQGLYALTLAEPSIETLELNFDSFASALFLDSNGIMNISIAPGGVVSKIYPLTGNEEAIGYAPLDDPREDIRADARLAIETGEIIVSGPDDLVQGGSGIVVRQAIYKDDSFWGFVNLVIDLSALVTEAGVDVPSSVSNLDFALRDGRGQVIFGSPDLFEQDPVLNIIELPEGVWELAAYPPDGWQAVVREPYLLFWTAGLVVVSLVVSLIYLSVNRQALLGLAVQERTSELSQLNSQLVQSHSMLEERVLERTKALSSLLDVSYKLASNLELQPLLDVILEQLQLIIGYDGAAIQLLEGDKLVIAASRGSLPAVLEKLSPVGMNASAENRLLRYWQTNSGSGPIRSNFNNSVIFQDGLSELDWDAAGPSWICIPLRYHRGLIGLMVLSHANLDYYKSRHESVVMVIANQAAVTIENAKLYMQSRHLAVLQERQRLARELHDSVSQALYGIALGAKTTKTLLTRDPAQAAEPLEYILTLSQGALSEMRALIFELRPESLEKEGLSAAIEKQAQVLRSRFGLYVETKLSEESALPFSLKEVFYRVAQEATHNITKHANAKQVEIELWSEAGEVILKIKDDGKGFDSSESFPGHLGLHSMQERVEQVGGDLVIESVSGEGTYIEVRVPITPPPLAIRE